MSMKIIVRGANWIGDAVMSVPALRALRRTFPDANITLHTKPWAEGIFHDADFIDRILTVEAGSSFRDTLREARRVSAGDYDLSILFTNSFQTAAVSRIAGVKKRLGYSREGRGVLLTDPIKPPPWEHERHQSFYYLHLIAELARRSGKEFLPITKSGDDALQVNNERRMNARSLLEEAGVDFAKPTIGFGAGSTNSAAKRWGEAKYADLATKLAGDLGANIVLLGAKNETDVSSQVAALSSAELIDLTGSTDLAMATAMLSELDLFVSNDMGLAHISAAVGTKTLVIFGPTNDETTRPLGEHAGIIRHPVECSPCMLRECPIDHRCMTRIEPNEVFRKVLEMMNG
jgi:heptosyltransferase-2